MTAQEMAVHASRASGKRIAGLWPWFRSVYSVVLFLLLWEVLALILAKPFFLPTPSSVIRSLFEVLLAGKLLGDIAISMFRALAGFSLAAVVGVGLGLLMGWYKVWDEFWNPLISLSYPMPKIALFPLFIIWLGIGEAPKIAIIFVACSYLTIINTHAGVTGTNRNLVWKAMTMGATNRELLLKVVGPHTLPHIFIGLRLAMGLSWIYLFSAEMLAAQGGLGSLIWEASRLMNIQLVFVAIMLIAALGFLFDRLIWFLSRRVCGWHFRGGEALGL